MNNNIDLRVLGLTILIQSADLLVALSKLACISENLVAATG